jgi:translation initiation factor IF-2
MTKVRNKGSEPRAAREVGLGDRSEPGHGRRDVDHARASHVLHSAIVAFEAGVEPSALDAARGCGIPLHFHRIIYELVEAIREMAQALLPRVSTAQDLGRAEVRRMFHVRRVGAVAGCQVVCGMIARAARARVLRGGKVIHEGRIGSLKRFQAGAREVKEGFECGLTVDGFDDLREGDLVETYLTPEGSPAGRRSIRPH